MKKKDYSTVKLVLLGLLFLGAMALVTVLAWPYIQMIVDPETQQEIQKVIDSMGFFGVLALFGLQVLQVVVAFIPGEPVELLAGVLYGGLGGLAICLAGCLVASAMVFALTRKFGVKLVGKLIKKKKLDEFNFLKESKKQDMAVFVLFLIPGTPKDLLTYVVGFSQMKMGKFLVLSSLARLPALVSSTYLGAAARQGQWTVVIILFAVTAAVGVAGILLKDKVVNCIMAVQKKHTEKNN